MKMLKTLGLGAAAAIGLLGATAQAEDYGAHDAAKDAAKSAAKSTALPSDQTIMTVTVQKVDKANNKIWFETEIADVANKAALDKLKPGDEVRASFDPNTGEVVKIELSGEPAGTMPMKDPLKDDMTEPVKPDDGM